MIKSKFLGTTREIMLPKDYGYDGYSVECTYKYDKSQEKYKLTMWLKHMNSNNKSKIEKYTETQYIDSQYIPGNQENIIENIQKIVEQMCLERHFDYYIDRMECKYKLNDNKE